ncbi:hypothetical protein [Absidia glauca]|uniref:Uncharacterized protein n=1 Tax=Absidia glauca TaxID=4829 RepID=A0A168Q1J4_ABSGL|nr:hypothetical protein [Absidia glauca]
MVASPNVNLSDLKRRLAQARIEKEQGDSELQTSPVVDASVIQHAMNSADRNLLNVTDEYLQRALNKQLKLDKHKAWRKRHRERKKNEKHDDRARPIDVSPPQSSEIVDQKSIEKAVHERPVDKQQQRRIQQLTTVAEKLIHLRDLRRKKLETKGHFFPESGDDFYNKVKAAALTKDNDKDDNEDTPIQPHADDKWPDDQPLDTNAYNFWLQGWTSVDRLVRIRQEWDQYVISPQGQPSSMASRIPPTMVAPPPPSSQIWASYSK